MEKSSTQSLLSAGWTFAKLMIPEEALRKAALSIAREMLGEPDAQGWTNATWAFAKLEVGEEALKKAVPSRARERLGEFSAQGKKTGTR